MFNTYKKTTFNIKSNIFSVTYLNSMITSDYVMHQ